MSVIIVTYPVSPQTNDMTAAKSPNKKTPTHPSAAVMVVAAISNLKEKNGSSLQAIKKYIAGNYNVDLDRQLPFIKRALKKGVSEEKLIQTKGVGASGSFKLNVKAAKAEEKAKKEKEKAKVKAQQEKDKTKAAARKEQEKQKKASAEKKKKAFAEKKKSQSKKKKPAKTTDKKEKKKTPKKSKQAAGNKSTPKKVLAKHKAEKPKKPAAKKSTK